MKMLPHGLCALALLLLTQTAGAISLGQFDTFQDGTTNGWETGQFAPPVTNISKAATT